MATKPTKKFAGRVLANERKKLLAIHAKLPDAVQDHARAYGLLVAATTVAKRYEVLLDILLREEQAPPTAVGETP